MQHYWNHATLCNLGARNHATLWELDTLAEIAKQNTYSLETFSKEALPPRLMGILRGPSPMFIEVTPKDSWRCK